MGGGDNGEFREIEVLLKVLRTEYYKDSGESGNSVPEYRQCLVQTKQSVLIFYAKNMWLDLFWGTSTTSMLTF